MIPPTPETDDLHGVNLVLDSCVLIDFHSCHSIVDAWKAGAPVDDAELVRRCTRARQALLMAIALHAQKARTYCLAYEPLDKLEGFAPPDVNEIPTAFVRATHHYVREVVLPDWAIVIPDDGGAPEPTKTAADRELARVAAAYRLPLVTLDSDLRKRATKAGVIVFSPTEYVASTNLDMVKEWDQFVQRYVAGIDAFASSNVTLPALRSSSVGCSRRSIEASSSEPIPESHAAIAPTSTADAASHVSTFSTCAFGPWRASKSAGRGMLVMERWYAGLVKVPDGCKTLEAAMQIHAHFFSAATGAFGLLPAVVALPRRDAPPSPHRLSFLRVLSSSKTHRHVPMGPVPRD